MKMTYPPLASFLADEMRERGWTTDDVAIRMLPNHKAPENALLVGLILSVQKDTLLVGDDTFLELERAFGVSAIFFRRLDQKWRDNPSARETFEPPDELFGPLAVRALTAVGKNGER